MPVIGVHDMKFTKVAAFMAVGAMLMTGCAGGENVIESGDKNITDGKNVIESGDKKITGRKNVIKAGDTKITKADIAFIADFYYEQNMQYGQSVEYETIRDQIFDTYKNAVIIDAVADLKDIELEDEIKRSYIAMVASFRSAFGGKKAFDKALKKAGANEDAIEIYHKADYLSSLLKEDETFKVAEANDDELKEFLKDNYLRAKHVLIQVGNDVATGDLEKSEAEKILERAKNGEDFDKLVEEFSQDPGSAANPDGYVFTEKEMVPEFEEGTRSIQPGEFTLVKTSYGYHIIQRLPLDESDEKFAELFENTKTSVALKYTEKKFNEMLKAYAEENGITVEVNKEVVSKITAPEIDTDTEE